MRCRYNAVNFLKNINKRHPIARPLGRGMGCLLWIQDLIDILPQFLQLLMQYLTTLHRVITALYCSPHEFATLTQFSHQQSFEPNLTYLGQRKYRYKEMYWITFRPPWPNVMAVTLMNTNLLVSTIKQEPLIQSQRNFIALSFWLCLSPDKSLE